MSITEQISDLVREGALIQYEAALKRNERPERILLLTPNAHSVCPAKGQSSYSRLRKETLAAARAQMTDFVAGKPVEYDHDFKWLKPRSDDVWELRTHQHPKLRLFGWFVCPNSFVVANCKLRSDLGSDQKKWSRAIGDVVSSRDRMFPGQRPFRGTIWAHYITSKAIGEF